MRGVLWVLLSLLAGPMQAQDRPRPVPRAREELYKMIDAYIFSSLQQSLGLSDEQFVRLMPLVRRYQGDRRRMVEERNEAVREMRQLLESGRATESRLGELLRRLRTLEDEEVTLLRKDADVIDAQLNTAQQAKLRVLQLQVDQRLRELMGRVRQQGRPNRMMPDNNDPPF
jgi:hypothetical protein